MRKHIIIYICFFLTGASALIYEILWTRSFSLTYGNTTYAITTVLSAFMAGLAFGSLVFGRIADRVRHRLRLYGLIEVCIGVYALIFPFLENLSSRLYLYLINTGDAGNPEKLLIKFILSFTVMLVPASLMGGSLPVISKFFIGELKNLPSRLGVLYSMNTLGAVAGTYLVGFHMIAIIGLRASMLTAAFLNIGIGIVVVLYALRLSKEEDIQDRVESSPEGAPSNTKEKGLIIFAVIAFMVSGFVSLSHEVVWTRILSLIIGSSTYAFTMILIGFLAGLALGSFLISHTGLIQLRRINLVMFSWMQIGIGISAYLLIPLFSKLPALMIKAFQLNPDSYTFITFYQFILSFLIMIIPTTLMGATLPVIGKIVSREVGSVGTSIGNIYFFNTFGALFGAFFAASIQRDSSVCQALLRS